MQGEVMRASTRHVHAVMAMYGAVHGISPDKADALLDEVVRVHLELDKNIEPIHMLSEKTWKEKEEGWAY